MGYAALTNVSGANGLAAVTFSMLEDAGFAPIVECDLRGWMHFYKWPAGSERPVTIYVPDQQHDEATAFLEATCTPSWDADTAEMHDAWAAFSMRRRAIYLGWLAVSLVGLGAGVAF